MSSRDIWNPIIERSESLSELLGAELYFVRDDLLPFPLAGNKVRKISAELASMEHGTRAVVTNGAVDSNHCRTLALFAAQRGLSAHLVLHGTPGDPRDAAALGALAATGATYDIGPADTISTRLSDAIDRFGTAGMKSHLISGGGHTPEGAIAFCEAGVSVFEKIHVDQVFLASGTGATQGGLVAASEQLPGGPEIIGVSIARDRSRGIGPVEEAAVWAGAIDPHITFLDEYRAGGYSKSDEQVLRAVGIGWQHGIPLDPTYTGKAFSALLDRSKRGLLPKTVAFWHTGGLWNWISSVEKRQLGEQ